MHMGLPPCKEVEGAGGGRGEVAVRWMIGKEGEESRGWLPSLLGFQLTNSQTGALIPWPHHFFLVRLNYSTIQHNAINFLHNKIGRKKKRRHHVKPYMLQRLILLQDLCMILYPPPPPQHKETHSSQAL